MSSTHPYMNPELPVNQRVADLLARMNLEEKVGQLMQLKHEGEVDARRAVTEWHIGSVLQALGPVANEYLKLSHETRLGIPVIMAVDAIHGHSFWPGATIFPTQLGMACTWDVSLVRQMGRITAREMRGTGVSWTFSPVLCLARDLRWGRIGETFGEDPLLVGAYGAALVEGYQGSDLSDPDSVLACAKHFAGYSETIGGRDASEANLSPRRLRSLFFPPFREAVEAGAGSFMTAYQAIDGVPATVNTWLLRDVLRGEWGFDGLVVTDYNNVGTLVTDQNICDGPREAAALAVKGGNNVIMQTPDFYEGCTAAVRDGLLDQSDVDQAVGPVLAAKFRMGLFEDPRFADPKKTILVDEILANRETALQAARDSIVLLGNNGALPIDASTVRKIAVVGPNANDPLVPLGDWALGTGQCNEGQTHPRESMVTTVDALRAWKKNQPELRVVWEPGCCVGDPNENEIARLRQQAVRVARESDVVVMVIGDDLRTAGERKSTATLELQDGQPELADAICECGTPVIAVILSTKPLALPDSVRNADALIQQFSPGMLGGAALVDVLFGRSNPSGKLAITLPRHVGQQPVCYNQIRGQHGDTYADLTEEPAFPFGYGLSYTSFEYGGLQLDKESYCPAEAMVAKIQITNAGNREGVETVQAYLTDRVTSVTWPMRELKAFSKVALSAGETRSVRFEIPISDFTVVDALGRRVVEPGEFELGVGSSSRPADQHFASFVVVQ